MTINFSCEVCGKTLSTSDDKAGRKAKCPGCGEMLIVPDPEGMTTGGPADFDDGSGAPPLPQQRAGRSTVACPMCGEKVSATADKCEFCGEPLEPGRHASRGHEIISSEDILSTGWNVFKADMGTALGVVIVAVLLMAAASVPQAVLGAMADVVREQGDPQTALVLQISSLLFLPVAYAVRFYIGCGQASALLKIARGEPTQIGELFQGGRFFWRNTGASLLFLLMFATGCAFCLVPGIIVYTMFWPYLFVLVDEDLPGIDCLGRAYTITADNRLAVFGIMFVSVLLGVVGLMALCVGVFFTVPWVMVMWAVAYCKMTGQRTAA